MIRGAIIFLCGIAAGVLVYDTALERAAVKPVLHQTYAPMERMAHPLQCDATVNGKCYRRGMK